MKMSKLNFNFTVVADERQRNVNGNTLVHAVPYFLMWDELYDTYYYVSKSKNNGFIQNQCITPLSEVKGISIEDLFLQCLEKEGVERAVNYLTRIQGVALRFLSDYKARDKEKVYYNFVHDHVYRFIKQVRKTNAAMKRLHVENNPELNGFITSSDMLSKYDQNFVVSISCVATKKLSEAAKLDDGLPNV
jgi:hypothetical protein